MKPVTWRPLLLAALVGCLSLVAGCGKSAPAHFYSLSAPAPVQAVETTPCIALGVGPVEFPAYLDRSQIVTRLGANQMHLADFDQWIEPLRDNFQRALMEDLAGLVCAKPLVSHPWPAGGHPDRQVAVQVDRFEGTLGQDAVLRANWTVLDADGKALAWRTADLREQVAGPDYASLAAAQSRLVARFATEVAASLRGE
jgi:uncharacterized lipoprotein YmbA